MVKVIPICGYRRTGKDTFHSILSKNPSSNSLDKFKWKIYKHPKRTEKSFDDSSYVRTAFADPLKREASEVYGIPLVVPDADKDIKQFKHYKTGELVSARDIYIEWGYIRRLQDIDYWCKAAFNSIDLMEKANCVVTDWRFRNEACYILNRFEDVITVRLYRSEVPEPPADIESEHDLDEYQTDFLLIPEGVEGEFEKAVTKFPQYVDYIPCESVN